MFVLHKFRINHVEELEQEYSKYQQCQKKNIKRPKIINKQGIVFLFGKIDHSILPHRKGVYKRFSRRMN